MHKSAPNTVAVKGVARNAKMHFCTGFDFLSRTWILFTGLCEFSKVRLLVGSVHDRLLSRWT